MPIVRTYMCPECAHRLEVTLPSSEWDAPAPYCPNCAARVNQEFTPPAIGGSLHARAAAITESIIANDYGVANYQPDHREGAVPKVRYKDSSPTPAQVSAWSSQLQQGIEIGRVTRQQYGNGFDVLDRMLKTGEQPDLIEMSKRRSIKIG